MRILVAFICGAILASGIAYFVAKDRLTPEHQPVAAAEQPAQASAETPAPVAAAESPAAPAPPPPPASLAREPVRSAKTAAKRSKPVETARSLEPQPAPSAEPLQPPQPVEPYRPETPSNPPAPTGSEAAVELAPPAAPETATVTIPTGTLLPVRLAQTLSTEREAAGDTFMATLAEPLVVDGYEIARRGARVEGKIVEADRGGRVKGVASLSIHLTRVTTADGQRIDIQTDLFEKQAPASTSGDAAKVGAATAIGAAIGAIAGGGKGAAIGAGVGGAAGTGGVLATRGKPAELSVETKINFRLSAPVTITEKR